MPITCALGTWQLCRGADKQLQLDKAAEQQQQMPIKINELKSSALAKWQEADLNYRPVHLLGRFDSQRTLFLDNQVYRNKPGYQVLTPIKTPEGHWFIVDRGWIAASLDRHTLPSIDDIDIDVEISGQLYKPKPFTLKQQQLTSTWPQRIQAIELNLLNQYFDHHLFSYTIRIDPESPLAYLSNWATDETMPPQRHYAYAAQWFTLALVLLIMALFANTNLRDYFRKSKP